MHQLVSPEAVLHLLPDDKRVKRKFCKAHQGKLRVAYLNNHLAGDEKYKKSHAGWQLLHMVKWLGNESSGAQVMVIGFGQHFFKSPARAAACERAGLSSSAMCFDEKEKRTFNRLLLGEVAEMNGWSVSVEPPAVREIPETAYVSCAVCGLLCVDLPKLINPVVSDEVASLRRQVFEQAKQIKLMADERERLRLRDAELSLRDNTYTRTLRRFRVRLHKVQGDSVWKLLNLLRKRAPTEMRHLVLLLQAQQRALQSRTLRVYWPEEILHWCATIFRKDRDAYSLMWSGQVLYCFFFCYVLCVF